MVCIRACDDDQEGTYVGATARQVTPEHVSGGGDARSFSGSHGSAHFQHPLFSAWYRAFVHARDICGPHTTRLGCQASSLSDSPHSPSSAQV